jgi:hypothetical protein
MPNRNNHHQEEEHPWDGLSPFEIFLGFFVIGIIVGFIRMLFS